MGRYSLEASFFAFVLLLLLSSTVRAQIPFYTDDADTTEKGKLHLEFFDEHDVLQKSGYPGKRQNTANLTLDYGLSSRVELAVNFPVLTIFNAKTSPQGNPTGVGDTQFGVKYRFRD
ncbi:MAG: hypothetical protein QOC61_631, partial [Acidobacteriota bacterium]|nr:hypothetical protein [Acidobacteriota bacterium]